MTNTNTHMAVAARRGLDRTSSLILHEVYLAYPNEVTFKTIEKKLNISNINISDYNRNEIFFNLGQIYYDTFYYYLDSCVLGEKAYNYVYESGSFEEAAQIKLLHSKTSGTTIFSHKVGT